MTTRDPADAGWAKTARMLRGMSDGTVKFTQRHMNRMDSVGQQRLNALPGAAGRSWSSRA